MTFQRSEKRALEVRTMALYMVILLVGVGLRGISLTSRPIWYDEAFAILFSAKGPAAMLYGTLTPAQGGAADVHPILYYTILYGWQLLAGSSQVAVRWPSLLLGLATVATIIPLTRRLWGQQSAIAAGLAVACAPFPIAYSQETRMYALLGLAGTQSLYWLVCALQDARRSQWIAFIVAGTVALYTHTLGVFFLGTILMVSWLKPRWPQGKAALDRRNSLRKSLLLAGGAIALLYTPWLAVVPAQVSKVATSYWVVRPGLTELVRTLIVFTTNLPLPTGWLGVALFGALFLWVLICYQLAHHRNHPAIALMLFGWLPVLFLFGVSQWRSIYIERAMLPAAITYLAVIGWLLSGAGLPTWLSRCLSALLVVGWILALSFHYQYQLFPRPPFQQAADWLSLQVEPGDAIVHSNKLTFFPFYYYHPDLNQSFLPDPAGSGSDTLARPTQDVLELYPTELDEAVIGAKRVWFLVFDRAIGEYVGTHPHVAWLSTRYSQTGFERFGDLQLHLYSTPAESGDTG